MPRNGVIQGMLEVENIMVRGDCINIRYEGNDRTGYDSKWRI